MIRRLVLTCALAIGLAGPTLAAEEDPIAALLDMKTLPKGGQWTPIIDGEHSLYFLQLPVMRSEKYVVGVIYRGLDAPTKIGEREMWNVMLARAAKCKDKTIADLGIVGFDEDGERIVGAPGEGGFQKAQSGTPDGLILEILCDPGFEPKKEDILSFEDAWDEVDDMAFAELITDIAPPAKPGAK